MCAKSLSKRDRTQQSLSHCVNTHFFWDIFHSQSCHRCEAVKKLNKIYDIFLWRLKRNFSKTIRIKDMRTSEQEKFRRLNKLLLLKTFELIY